MDRTGYYDAEATSYDASRGGDDRAKRAADAVLSLVPGAGLAVDVAGGTGIVSELLAARGLDVIVLDRSTGMLRVAAERLPGRVLAGDASSLPVPDASVDLVTMIWLLHLLPVPVADEAMVEAARVLRPGGHLVTTVDKDLAHGRPAPRIGGDGAEHVAAQAARLGLGEVGCAEFSGTTGWDTDAPDERATFRLVAYRRS